MIIIIKLLNEKIAHLIFFRREYSSASLYIMGSSLHPLTVYNNIVCQISLSKNEKKVSLLFHHIIMASYSSIIVNGDFHCCKFGIFFTHYYYFYFFLSGGKIVFVFFFFVSRLLVIYRQHNTLLISFDFLNERTTHQHNYVRGHTRATFQIVSKTNHSFLFQRVFFLFLCEDSFDRKLDLIPNAKKVCRKLFKSISMVGTIYLYHIV